jgi:hypothetical protein
MDLNGAELCLLKTLLDGERGQLMADRVDRDQRDIRQLQFHGWRF